MTNYTHVALVSVQGSGLKDGQRPDPGAEEEILKINFCTTARHIEKYTEISFSNNGRVLPFSNNGVLQGTVRML